MALFKVNTGCRDREVCSLKWDDEVKVPELDTSVFIIPGDRVKNAQDRLVVLNRIARSIVQAQRGQHPSVEGCGRPACHSRIVRICWATRMDGSRRTTRGLNSQASLRLRRRCAMTQSHPKSPQASVCGGNRAD